MLRRYVKNQVSPLTGKMAMWRGLEGNLFLIDEPGLGGYHIIRHVVDAGFHYQGEYYSRHTKQKSSQDETARAALLAASCVWRLKHLYGHIPVILRHGDTVPGGFEAIYADDLFNHLVRDRDWFLHELLHNIEVHTTRTPEFDYGLTFLNGRPNHHKELHPILQLGQHKHEAIQLLGEIVEAGYATTELCGDSLRLELTGKGRHLLSCKRDHHSKERPLEGIQSLLDNLQVVRSIVSKRDVPFIDHLIFRAEEVERCVRGTCFFSAFVMLGSIQEGMYQALLRLHPPLWDCAREEEKIRSQTTKKLQEVSPSAQVCQEIAALAGLNFPYEISNTLKTLRNGIHPSSKLNANPGNYSAEAIGRYLEMVSLLTHSVVQLHDSDRLRYTDLKFVHAELKKLRRKHGNPPDSQKKINDAGEASPSAETPSNSDKAPNWELAASPGTVIIRGQLS